MEKNNERYRSLGPGAALDFIQFRSIVETQARHWEATPREMGKVCGGILRTGSRHSVGYQPSWASRDSHSSAVLVDGQLILGKNGWAVGAVD